MFYLRNHCQVLGYEDLSFHLILSLAAAIRSSIHFQVIFYMTGFQFHPLTCECLVVTVPLVENAVRSRPSYFGTTVNINCLDV